jgi:hypothetical protein
MMITYFDASRREDLIDVVTNVSPKETPLLSGLPMGPGAQNTLHEWVTATFEDYGDNAGLEGAAFSADTLSAPVRSNNVTQIFKQQVQVSGSEVAVNGVTDPWSYQLQKNLVEHAKDLELAFMAGSRNSGGSTGTARRLQGIINAITTNASTRASGSSLGEVAFNDIMALIWNGTGEVADEVFVGATLKRDISGFTAGSTKFTQATDGRLHNSFSVYESDFGVHKIFLHRNVPTAANNLTLVAINPKFHKKSYLRPTKTEQLSKDGDRVRAQIITEVTLEHLAEKTGAVFGGFTS